MLEKVDEVIFSVDDIDLDDIDSDTTIFFKDGIGLVTIHLNNINYVSDSFDEDDPKLLLVLDLWLSVRNLNIAKRKKDRRGINAYSMAFSKRVGFVHHKR